MDYLSINFIILNVVEIVLLFKNNCYCCCADDRAAVDLWSAVNEGTGDNHHPDDATVSDQRVSPGVNPKERQVHQDADQDEQDRTAIPS